MCSSVDTTHYCIWGVGQGGEEEGRGVRGGGLDESVYSHPTRTEHTGAEGVWEHLNAKTGQEHSGAAGSYPQGM
jgi:hypothetical protein